MKQPELESLARPKGKPPVLGRILLLVVSLGLVGLFVEGLAAFRLSRTLDANPYSSESRGRFHAQLMDEGAAADPEVAAKPVLALHPYIGYYINVDRNRPYRGVPSNQSGFYSEVEATYRPADTNEFVVVVLGGSVAAQLCTTGLEHLRQRISEIPEVAGRRVVINALNQGGYKQPQQLLIMTYYLTLGLHADLVINLDGVNELVFYPYLRKEGITPSYPWNWAALSPTPERDRAVMEAQLEVLNARESRGRIARRALALKAHRSAAGWLVWNRLNGMAIHREKLAENALQEAQAARAARGLPYAQRGPGHSSAETMEESLRESAVLWRRANIALSDVLKARDIPFLHALQPNQYFPGTRELHPLEREFAYDPTSNFHEPLSKGYAHLADQFDALIDHGVTFVDLNQRLEPTPEIIYDDNFSHFNPLGYTLIGDALAKEVAELLRR